MGKRVRMTMERPRLDRAMHVVSRLTRRSLVWVVAAALLGPLGRFGRRAAFRGLFSVSASTVLAGLPAYAGRRALKRYRRRRGLEKPTRPFSRHALSGFAFATGASLERPYLAPVLFGSAATVSYARVRTGERTPAQALVGAALGTAAALATRRMWPVAPDEPARARPAIIDFEARPGPDGSNLSIVVNPAAGNGFTRPATDLLRDALPGAQLIEVGEGLDLRGALDKAASASECIGICGGDGSVNAAARFAHDLERPLAVFPGGTLNHFARDAGLFEWDDAVEAVREGQAGAVDVGLIADKPFVNTAGFGNYADLVDLRERLEPRLGKWPAALAALVVVLARSEPVEAKVDGRPVRLWMFFAGNCRYQPNGFAPSWRERLDDGILDIRTVEASHRWARLRLAWAVATGRLERCRVYRADIRDSPVKIEILNAPVRLTRDGETFDGPSTFEISKSSRRLTVLLPPDQSATPLRSQRATNNAATANAAKPAPVSHRPASS